MIIKRAVESRYAWPNCYLSGEVLIEKLGEVLLGSDDYMLDRLQERAYDVTVLGIPARLFVFHDSYRGVSFTNAQLVAREDHEGMEWAGILFDRHVERKNNPVHCFPQDSMWDTA